MVLSSGYISYMFFLERESETAQKNSGIISEMNTELDSLETGIRSNLIDHHDRIFMELVSDPEEWNSSRLDGALEGRLAEDLENEILGYLESESGQDYICELENITVSIVPVSVSILSPSSKSSEYAPNGTGPWDYGWRPASMGANTSISVTLSSSTPGKGTVVLRNFDINIVRESVTDVLYQRMDRLLKALKGPELGELYQHMISSLAGAKAYLGYGRSMSASDTLLPPPILTDQELASCLDLSVHLLSRAYLGIFDLKGLEEVERILRSAEGSWNCSPPLPELLEGHEGPVDPGMLVMVLEGLFSETSPPGPEDLLRPLFLSLVERFALGLIDYIGLDTGILNTFGGVTGFFRGISESVDSFFEDTFGCNLIDTRDTGVRSLIRDLYRYSSTLSEIEGSVMLREVNGISWMDREVDGYPQLSFDPFEREFSAMILENSTNVTEYSIVARYHLPSHEPEFRTVSILNDRDVLEGISNALGVDEGIISAEVTLRESAENIIRDAVEKLITRLVDDAPETWDSIWNGWEYDSPPPLDCGICPTAYLASLSLSSIPFVADELAAMIESSPDLFDLEGALGDIKRIIGEPVSDWCYDNYRSMVGGDIQAQEVLLDYTETLPGSVEVEVIDSEKIGSFSAEEGYLTGSDGQPLDIHGVLNETDILAEIGLGLDRGEVPGYLLDMILDSVNSSMDIIREREFGRGDVYPQPGFIRSSFQGEITRSETPGEILSSLNLSRFRKEVEDNLRSVMRGVMNDTSGAEMLSASRHFLPPLNGTGDIVIRRDHAPFRPMETITPYLEVYPAEDFISEMDFTGGYHDPDPTNEGSPYRTDINITLSRGYDLEFGSISTVPLCRNIRLDVKSAVSVYTVWPLQGASYEEGTTLYDLAMDKGKQAAMKITEELLNGSTSLLSGTLSSLQEVPPLINDIIENGDLDLAEASRVLSNVTMELSSALRDLVKDLIKQLVEMGLTGILSALLDILGIDEFNVDLRFGPLGLGLRTEKSALFGEEGTLLEMTVDVVSIGLFGYLSLNRVENSTIKFNGTIRIEKGPLYMRMEVDPFMEDRPHMFSVEGHYGIEGGISFSFSVPTLEEYKVSEISLSGSLGVEPMIPIPPLGINAVVDGGFRLRYRMPEELPPVLNEINFEEGNITWIEIFNPRLHPFGGSTLEMRDEKDKLILSWILQVSPESHTIVDLSREMIWRTGNDSACAGNYHVVLRSPSGLIMDDVRIEDAEDGAYARDKDGFGIWRWKESTPASPNSEGASVSIKTMIISMAFTSIKEAWSEAYDLFGFSFDTVTHFLERAVELFMERFLAMISELVIDVRIFLKLEIEDASGSAGGGLELSLRAEGEAVALFLEWLYHNIRIIVSNVKDPKSSGDLVEFPLHVLEKCWITLMVFAEIETPVSVGNMAPEGTNIPDSLTYGFSGSVNLALPLDLMGKDIGDWRASFGVKVMEAPPSVVSLFYEVDEFGGTTDLWILKGEIWESPS